MVNRVEIEEFLLTKEWAYKEVSGDEFNVQTCFKCGDSNWHFYINSKTGIWYCHQGDCEAAGNWYTLLRDIGDTIPIRRLFDDEDDNTEQTRKFASEHVKLQRSHEKLVDNEEATKWLEERKISAETAQAFCLGANVDEKGQTWMSFPYISEGQLKNCKYRTIGEKRIFRRLVGGESVLYNEDYVIRSEVRKRLLLTEGETDLLSVHSAGIPWVAGVTIGSKGINTKWIDQLEKFGRIYICFDGDLPGQKGAQQLAKRLGYERCFNVSLPMGCGDINEYFSLGKTKQDFLELIKRARPFEVEYIIPIRTAIRQVAEEFKLKGAMDTGIHMPWPSLDRRMGGLLGGDLLIITGIPGIGKTTLALNVGHHLALDLGIPVLFFCLEMRPERLARKVMSVHLNKDSQFLREEDVLKCFGDFGSMPFYFGYAYRDLTMDKVANTVREAVRRYGIGFMVFDHLHFLCRNISNMVNEVGVTIRAFKMLAEDEGIPMCVIVHPRKVPDGKVPSMMDLRDSGLLPADADFVTVVHRKKNKPPRGQTDLDPGVDLYDDTALIRVEKARYSEGGDAYLHFDGARSNYSELA